MARAADGVVVKSLISSSSSWSPLSAALLLPRDSADPCERLDVREKDPRLEMSVLWFAGFTVTMRLELLATIMSVTWSRLLPMTSIPLTSSTSSLTASRPVLSARPPGTSLDMKIPGTFSRPAGVTRTLVPSRM